MECKICSKSPTFNLNRYHDMYDLSSTICKVLEIPNFAGYFNSSTLCFTCIQKSEQAKRMFNDIEESKLRLSKIKVEFEEDLKSRSFNFNNQNGPHIKIEDSSAPNCMDIVQVQEDVRTSSNDDMEQLDYSHFSLIHIDQANSTSFNQNRAETETSDTDYSSSQSLLTLNRGGHVLGVEGYPDLIIVQDDQVSDAEVNYGPKSSSSKQAHDAKDISQKVKKKRGHPKISNANATNQNRYGEMNNVKMTFDCKKCKTSFGFPDELQSHNEMVHKKNKVRHPCPEQDCEDTFVTRFSLHRHLEKKHNRKFKCNIGVCRKRFSDLDSFNEHQTHHQNDKPRPKDFPSNTHLIRHQHSHSNTPNRCPYPDCDAHFVYPHRLQLHIKQKHTPS